MAVSLAVLMHLTGCYVDSQFRRIGILFDLTLVWFGSKKMQVGSFETPFG
ncbi:MAG: hypothetical protein AB8B55_19225 [Mariniblastus sp.]